MEKIFDFHFHLLFKHYIAENFELQDNVDTKGLAKLLNEVFGGPFDSQASPKIVAQSALHLGVIGIVSLEHAFANRILNLLGINFYSVLPIKKGIVERTKNGTTSYFYEFKDQLQYYLDNQELVKQISGINYLNRKDYKGKTPEQIKQILSAGKSKYFAFSIEGGHNLSDVPIRSGALSRNPNLNLSELQSRTDIDFISLNLCHLSEIPEQPLGGFAQGVNTLSKIAFNREDFLPKTGLGLTELGKKVIRQALGHTERPILIDVKHMSVYTRFHYYRFREKLIIENPEIEKLPIISSHSGFVFNTIDDYIKNKKFRSSTGTEGMAATSRIESENRQTGDTENKLNSRLYCNPWTINLFDEEIAEIMASRGMIGISLDQRILGASGIIPDGKKKDKYYEGEYIAVPEWEKLFRDGILPTSEEGLFDSLKEIVPSRPERHVMLLCMHLVHGVRVGYASASWSEGTSPWHHLCLGTDFDGFINPINGIENVESLSLLRSLLFRYLPQADKTLMFYKGINALKYDAGGVVEESYLHQVIDRFLFQNGLDFMVRFLGNWAVV